MIFFKKTLLFLVILFYLTTGYFFYNWQKYNNVSQQKMLSEAKKYDFDLFSSQQLGLRLLFLTIFILSIVYLIREFKK